MLTKINDSYNFKNLECQYYEICKGYEPDKCLFGEPCHKNGLRNLLREKIEDYIAFECLENQIKINESEI